jgi:hypothetical protein
MIQPGIGYTFINDGRGASLIIDTAPAQVSTPFSVYEDSTAEGTAILRITKGTINNQLPTVDGSEIGTDNAYLPKPTSSGFIVLEVPASEDSADTFPADVPTISFQATVPGYDNTMAYVALAKVDIITVPESPPSMTINQLVTGSIWAERFQCGNQVDYWFSHI